MAEEQFTNTSRRLGLGQNIGVIRKAEELHRLIGMKNTPISVSAKIVFSIECAATLLGHDYDMPMAIKLSGLNVKEYKRQMEMFKKLLDLKKQVSASDFCLKLELNGNVREAANKLLKAYRSQLLFGEDVNEARYVTMAVCCAAKQLKVKGNRIRRQMKAESGLSGAQWDQLEEKWNKWIEKEKPLGEKHKPIEMATVPAGADGVPADVISDAETNNVTSLQSMPYEAWKDEILKRAYALIQMEVEQDSDMSSSQEF